MHTGQWSSQEVFLEWVETVLVKETQPVSNPHKCILLLMDGSVFGLESVCQRGPPKQSDAKGTRIGLKSGATTVQWQCNEKD